MKITCPECFSAFDIPAAMMGPEGRRMKCSTCGHIWHQRPVTERQPYAYAGQVDPIPASLHPDAHDDEEDAGPGFFSNPSVQKCARITAGFLIGWAVILALVYTLALGGILPHVLAPLAMGAHKPDLHGLEFHDVVATPRDAGGVTLAGRIFNNSETPLVIPMVEILPTDADGEKRELHQVRPEQDSLQPHEGVQFSAEIPDIGADAKLRLRFLPEG